jgi:hypothetical protein
MGLATFWALFSQTHPVNLHVMYIHLGGDLIFCSGEWQDDLLATP